MFTIDPDDDKQIEYVAQFLQHNFMGKAGEIRPSYVAARTVLIAMQKYMEDNK